MFTIKQDDFIVIDFIHAIQVQTYISNVINNNMYSLIVLILHCMLLNVLCLS